jgi:hydroxyacylglutathione hydrolase
MEQWFDGIYLLGQYNPLRTGCWLLAHGDSAAVLEMPPYNSHEPSPALAAQRAARELGVTVRHLLCSHAHGDHFDINTYLELRRLFPDATVHLQSGFRQFLSKERSIEWFDENRLLFLDGEPLFLVHAPKHSVTDTMVIFRGAICTGDWELGTIRSVHDGKGKYSVPLQDKMVSIGRMMVFESRHDYRIHRVYSVHANDRRDYVNFAQLMEDTRVDRKLW